ncbi:MAG: hypothetical protein DI626_04225 [Micavibrio aeruginosavorus]|uniref:Uncharacterized protein n=1 Tax=Micavibrio aeruginosavorus TaxID=349221 RepID=A0A2W5BW61_9BACT|nr:MAG: hypothetical protein DI626_04225 [Micavibrio aeruginosavorus]
MAQGRRPGRQEQLKTIEGLGFLVNGEPSRTDAFASLPDAAISTLARTMTRSVDKNAKPVQSFGSSISSFFSGGPAPQGAKEKLQTILDRAESDAGLSDPNEIKGFQAALSASGYEINFDGTIDAREKGYIADFRQRLNSGMSLGAIANKNFADADALATENANRLERERQQRADLERRQAAERDAGIKQQENIYNRYSSGLVYAGYLDPAKAADPKAAATAMAYFIVDNAEDGKYTQVRDSLFSDVQNGTPSQAAVEYLQKHTQGQVVGTRLQADLESNDPARIRLAQNFMAFEGRDVQATGTIDAATFKNGEESIRAPLTMPPGLVTNGEVDISKLYIMAERGQLYLPMEKLSPEDQAIAKKLDLAKDRKPGDPFSREQFIAARLVLDDPAKYEQLLAQENTRRAGLKLDVTVEQPKVEVAAEATKLEERQQLNNPLGIRGAQEGLGGALISGSAINNDAIGTSGRTGQLAFSSTEKNLSSFVTFMKESSTATNGLVSMHDAMKGLHYASVNMQEAFLGGATGSGGLDAPTIQHANKTAEMLGVSADYKFNLNNPEDVKKLLTGLVGYNNRDSLGRDFVEGTRRDPKWSSAIENVAKGKPETTTPETAPGLEQNTDSPAIAAKGGRLSVTAAFDTARFGTTEAETPADPALEGNDADLAAAMQRRNSSFVLANNR